MHVHLLMPLNVQEWFDSKQYQGERRHLVKQLLFLLFGLTISEQDSSLWSQPAIQLPTVSEYLLKSETIPLETYKDLSTK